MYFKCLSPPRQKTIASADVLSSNIIAISPELGFICLSFTRTEHLKKGHKTFKVKKHDLLGI